LNERERYDDQRPVSADDKADLAKGACYNDTRVEVELAGPDAQNARFPRGWHD
jgi:hypothetical protein